MILSNEIYIVFDEHNAYDLYISSQRCKCVDTIMYDPSNKMYIVPDEHNSYALHTFLLIYIYMCAELYV